MERIAGWIDLALRHRGEEAATARIRQEVFEQTGLFPIPE